EPGAAAPEIDAADVRRAGPVRGGRAPGPADELVADRGDEQRPRGVGVETQQDCAHRFIVPRAAAIDARERSRESARRGLGFADTWRGYPRGREEARR